MVPFVHPPKIARMGEAIHPMMSKIGKNEIQATSIAIGTGATIALPTNSNLKKTRGENMNSNSAFPRNGSSLPIK